MMLLIFRLKQVRGYCLVEQEFREASGPEIKLHLKIDG